MTQLQWARDGRRTEAMTCVAAQEGVDAEVVTYAPFGHNPGQRLVHGQREEIASLDFTAGLLLT